MSFFATPTLLVFRKGSCLWNRQVSRPQPALPNGKTRPIKTMSVKAKGNKRGKTQPA